MQPVTVEPRGTAVWPGGVGVLTLCATPPLSALHRRLGAALTHLGIALDARPFAPHVTLARRATDAGAPVALPDLAWRTGAVALVESRRGKPYGVLATFG
jgi:2'-5' RNA ligase